MKHLHVNWLAIALLGGLSFFARAEHTVPRDYLLLKAQFAQQLSKDFGIQLKEGFYYTNQWVHKYDRELQRPVYFEEKNYQNSELAYLRDDPSVVKIYGGIPWKGDDFAFKSVRVGWVDFKQDKGPVIRQLWLQRSTFERYKLYEYEKGQPKVAPAGNLAYYPTYIPSTGARFFTVENGIMVIDDSGELWLAVPGYQPIRKFSMKVFGRTYQAATAKLLFAPGSRNRRQSQSQQTSGNSDRVPMFAYHAESQKVLIVLDPACTTKNPQQLRQKQGKGDLAVLDLGTNQIEVVFDGFPAKELALDSKGIWYSRPTNANTAGPQPLALMHRPMRWAVGRFARDEKVVHEYVAAEGELLFENNDYTFVDAGTQKPFRFTSDGRATRVKSLSFRFDSVSDVDRVQDIKEFKEGIPQPPTNPMEDWRDGIDEPIYWDSSINRALANGLSKLEYPAVLVVYKPGQMVEGLVKNALWGIDHDRLATPAYVSDVEEVFQVDGASLWRRKTAAEVNRLFNLAYHATEQTKSILWLKDFPHENPLSFKSKASEAHDAFQIMQGKLNVGLKAGKIRLLITMKQEIYDALKKLDINFDAGMSVAIVPDLPQKEVIRVAKSLIAEEEQRVQIFFSDDALKRALRMSRERRHFANKYGLVSPMRDVEFLKKILRDTAEWNQTAALQKVREIGLAEIQRLERPLQNVRTRLAGLGNTIDFQELEVFLKRHIAGEAHKDIIDEFVVDLAKNLGGTSSAGPSPFLFVGKPGSGKERLVKLTAKFLLSGGDVETALSMSDRELIEFNMGAVGTGKFSIPTDGPIARQIDNVFQALTPGIVSDLNRTTAANIVALRKSTRRAVQTDPKKKVYDLSNLGALFLTAEWGAKLIDSGAVEQRSFWGQLERELQTAGSDEDKKKDVLGDFEWVWMTQNRYVFPNLSSKDLLEWAFVWARDIAFEVEQRTGNELHFDPRIFKTLVLEATKSGKNSQYLELWMRAAVRRYDDIVSRDGADRMVITMDRRTGAVALVQTGDAGFRQLWNDAEDDYEVFERSCLDPSANDLLKRFLGNVQQKQQSQQPQQQSPTTRKKY